MNYLTDIRIITFYFALLLGSNLLSQSKVDSLLHEFESNDNQATKIKCLLDIGDEVYYSNLDSSELVWHQALIMSNNALQSGTDQDSENILFYKSESLSKLGELNDFLGHFEIAIEHYNQSLEIKKEISDSANLPIIYSGLSLAHYHNGDYKLSMHYSTVNLEYYEKTNNTPFIANTYYDIAYIYLKLQEYKKAKEAFDQSMKLYEELHDYEQQAYLLSGLSEYYIYLEKWDQAEEEAINSIILMNQLGDKIGISIPYSLMGRIKTEKEQYDSAKYYLDLSQNIKSDIPDIQKSMENYTYYSILYSSQNQWDNALEYANLLLDLSLSVDDKIHIRDAYELLYKIYEEKRDYKNAFHFYKSYHRVENDLSVGENRRLLLQAELEFEIRQQKMEDSLKLENLAKVQESQKIAHDAEITTERRTNTLLFGGLAIILVALIGFIRSNRINKKNNRIISGQNKQLTSKATLYKILKVCSSDQSMLIIMQEVLNELVLVPWFVREKKAYIFTLNEQDKFELKANVNYSDPVLTEKDMERRELKLVRDEGQRHYHIPVINEGKLLGVLKLYVWDRHEETRNEVNFLESIALLLGETLQRNIIEKNLRLAHIENTLKKKEIEMAHKEVSSKNKLLETLNKEITESINYAKRLQESILPSKEYLDSVFPDQFIIHAPKDIVGGDFYWVGEYDDGIRMIACVDCSGHGIPGAFMTMMGRLLLREIATVGGLRKPDEILNEMDLTLRKVLKQTDYDAMQDGMDMSLCVIDEKSGKIHFSSALRPVLILKKGGQKLEKLPDVKFPIGGYYEVEKEFKSTTFNLNEIERFYMYSDGYTDQFGGENRKKFGTNRFISMINEILHENTRMQREKLIEQLLEWKGENDQIDDILVIGVKL